MSTFSSNAVIVDIVTTCVLHHHNRTKWYIINTQTTNNEGSGTFFSYYSLEATIDHFLASFGPSVRRTNSRQEDTIRSRYCIFYITRYISSISPTLNICGAIISTHSTAVFTVPLLLTLCSSWSSRCSVQFL